MYQVYNYNRSDNKNFNDIVDEAIFLASCHMSGKELPSDYEARNAALNEAICRYAVEGTRFEAKFEQEGVSIMKSPVVNRNADVCQNYNVVIAEIINAIVPTVVSRAYTRYLTDVRQVGWGDTARFIVKSNALFQVNEIAEGVNRGVLQPIYNQEYVVNCKTVEIATSIDWYSVAANGGAIASAQDWGLFSFRAGRSFEEYIMVKIVASMAQVSEIAGEAYSIDGVDTDNWTTLADRVSAANGHARVYAIGTVAALNKVIPATIAGQQYVLGEQLGTEMIKDGFLGRYLGTTLIPIDQAIMGSRVNTTADLMIPTDVIYMVASDAHKPIKIVFEGDSVVVEKIPEETTDKTYTIRIQMKLGVGIILGSKIGTINLS